MVVNRPIAGGHSASASIVPRLDSVERDAPRDPARRARWRRGRAKQHPPRRRRGRGGSGNRGGRFWRVVYWSAVIGLWLLLAVVGLFAWVAVSLPPIHTLQIPKRPPSIQIVANDGQPLAVRGEGGPSVSLKELPRHVPQAFIAIEDRRFYSHFGLDPIGISRAVIANVLRRGVAQGGSTITQQLAKNLFLTQERTLMRKLQEALLALWLERNFTKDELLELYLNRVYFGAGAYGIQSAAQRYFNKPARELTLAEAAVLAGIVRSPTRLAPSRNPDAAERRAQHVLAAMAEQKFITDQMATMALAYPARAIRAAGHGAANYVADWIMDVLDDLIGRIEEDIVITTSIDAALQAAAEQALIDALASKGEKAGVSQGAIVVMAPDGTVRALVGGKNYAESQFNRAVAAKRQPGSAFKPFVYLTALERGLTPDTVREDSPVSIKGWRPENYSHEYFGPVTLQQALAHSLNTVSVRLIMEVGPPAVIRTAHRLGIASKLEPNPSLALGTSEVSLLELVSAFAPFANGGSAVASHVIERVRTLSGKVLYERAPQHLGTVIEPRYVAMMNAMLHEALVSGTARRADLPGWTAAGKTGTSQQFRDAWFIGYTAHLVTGVWLGNDDGAPTKKVTGGSLPVEIWNKVMQPAHRGVPVASLPGLGKSPLAGLLPPWQTLAPLQRSQPPPEPAADRIDTWLLDRLFGRR
ncbi:MAG TPA: transglycosylase domain-containing protein [Xanthobacteraceae bacterium]|nr:transglycosylase domain-containing protein [Xanthobacteraceae bacterium]